MATNLPPCCPASPPDIWEGTPTGKITTIDGIEIYIAQPQPLNTDSESLSPSTAAQLDKSRTNKRVILNLTEGHSIYFLNAQLLADAFASSLNCDVVMPDLFAGKERVPKGAVPYFPTGKDALDPQVDDLQPPPAPYFLKESTAEEFEAWKASVEPDVTNPILERVIDYIHAIYGNDVHIGGVGYCFGGRYIIRLMGADILDVGVVNHPSFFTMEEVSKLGKGKRLAVFAAEKDDIFPKGKRREMEDVLEEKGVSWVGTVFGGTEHGFAVRGDLGVGEVRRAKEGAFRGAVGWFGEWLV